MPEATDFRTIETSVRPARVAVLVNSTDAQWMHTCLRLIEWSTAVWGGWYTCLIPTDGEIVSPIFLELLERFDPDYIYKYAKTGVDIRLSDPERFQELVETQVAAFLERYGGDNGDDPRPMIERGLTSSEVADWPLSASLIEQLRRQVNPFLDRQDFEVSTIHARPETTGYPLTGVAQVASNLAEPLSVTAIEIHPEAAPSLPLQLMAFDLAGKVWPELAESLRQANAEVMIERQRVETMATLLPNLWRGAHSVWDASLAVCGVYSGIESRPLRLPYLVVIGDQIEDFCLYHALERMRGNTLWLPKGLLDCHRDRSAGLEPNGEYNPGEEHVYRGLLALLQLRSLATSALFASGSLPDEELQTLAEEVGAAAHVNVTVVTQIGEMLPSVRRVFNQDNVGRRYRDMFHGGQSVNYVNTPIPKHLKQVPAHGLHWITDVGVEGYRLPRRPEFGPATVNFSPYGSGEVRVTGDGFSYFCPHVAYFGGDLDTILARPRLQILPPIQVFERVFSAVNLHVRYSDKGNYHLGCLKMFGTLANLAGFCRDGRMRILLDLYLDIVGSQRGRGVVAGGRRYLDLAAIERLVAASAPGTSDALEIAAIATNGPSGHPHRDAAGQLAEELLLRGVLRRGFIFQCQQCRQVGWYAIEDVTETFQCQRCRAIQVYTRRHWDNPHEPTWFYGLNEIVYQFYSNNGHVPVLTLDVLRREARHSFLYVPECELLPSPEARRPSMELDFCCCIDGVFYIGEAKKADQLERRAGREREAMERYRETADQIGAEAVVLSTASATWSVRTMDNAREIIGHQRLRVFSGPELLVSRPT